MSVPSTWFVALRSSDLISKMLPYLLLTFFRFDYRSVGNEAIHQSVWVYYFTGEYLRAIHRQTLRDVDDFAVPFLALPEVQAVPIWREVYDIGESMTNWVRTQQTCLETTSKAWRLFLCCLVVEFHRDSRD